MLQKKVRRWGVATSCVCSQKSGERRSRAHEPISASGGFGASAVLRVALAGARGSYSWSVLRAPRSGAYPQVSRWSAQSQPRFCQPPPASTFCRQPAQRSTGSVHSAFLAQPPRPTLETSLNQRQRQHRLLPGVNAGECPDVAAAPPTVVVRGVAGQGQCQTF